MQTSALSPEYSDSLFSILSDGVYGLIFGETASEPATAEGGDAAKPAEGANGSSGDAA